MEAKFTRRTPQLRIPSASLIEVMLVLFAEKKKASGLTRSYRDSKGGLFAKRRQIKPYPTILAS